MFAWKVKTGKRQSGQAPTPICNKFRERRLDLPQEAALPRSKTVDFGKLSLL